MNNERYPKRKFLSHSICQSNKFPPIAFVTVCVKKRDPLLANCESHEIFKDLWSDRSRWMVGKYVILPDHIHLFAVPGEISCDLTRWVGWWKKEYNLRVNGNKISWQKSCFDHRVRNHSSFESIWKYMQSNPIKHGYVTSFENWKFQGEINDIWNMEVCAK